MNDKTHQHIDAKGLNCPIPLMMLKKAIEALPSGAVVSIDVTDEHAELDFVTWCERFGHQLKRQDLAAGLWRFKVSKS